MNISLDQFIDAHSLQFQRFLFEDNWIEYPIIPSLIPLGFENDPDSDRWYGGVEIFPFKYVVEESYSITQRRVARGISKVIIVKEQEVKIEASTWIFFKKGTTDNVKHIARDLMHKFTGADSADVERYIKDALLNIPGSENAADIFLLRTGLSLTKSNDPVEINIEQRVRLFEMYEGEGEYSHRSIIWPAGGGDDNYTYSQWVSDNIIELTLIGVNLAEDPTPVENEYVREIAGDPRNAANVIPIIREITRDLIPTSCGKMHPDQFKLLSVPLLPEVKISWPSKKIKVGCVWVTITYMVVEFRTAELAAYVYFSLPVSYGASIFVIVKSCAIKSALAAGVMGLLTSNIAVAVVTFKQYFFDCIKSEFLECVHPGLLLVKECGNWH